MRYAQSILAAILLINYSCSEDKLDEKFEKHIVRVETIEAIDSVKNETPVLKEVIIGYNRRGQKVKETIILYSNAEQQGERFFYEYDSLGRITKKYLCGRDLSCEHPSVHLYKYADELLSGIYMKRDLSQVEEPYTLFFYDEKKRLIKKVTNADTIFYTYYGDDTLIRHETIVGWHNDPETQKAEKDTIRFSYQYDNLHRRTQKLLELSNGFSILTTLNYDNKNRLVSEKDSSLHWSLHEPNTCCILMICEYKYNNQGKLIEEKRLQSSFDFPTPQLHRSTAYVYK